MIETRLLHYFLTVAREQNITHAAQLLHITQPTLSRQMTLLEEAVGAKLFHRDSRPLTLTAEGLLLQRRAEEILELIAKTEAEVSACEEPVAGTISLGCGELASVQLLAKWIAEFQTHYPRVTFQIYTAGADQICQRMDNGLTDIGLLLEPIDVERYEYLRMPVQERWAALLPVDSPLAEQTHVTAQDLSQLPIIMPSRQKVHSEVANWFGEHYASLAVPVTCNLSTNAALLVQAGLGCALTVEGAQPFLDETQMRMVVLEPELYSSSVLAWKRGQPFPATVQRFLQHVKYLAGIMQG